MNPPPLLVHRTFPNFFKDAGVTSVRRGPTYLRDDGVSAYLLKQQQQQQQQQQLTPQIRTVLVVIVSLLLLPSSPCTLCSIPPFLVRFRAAKFLLILDFYRTIVVGHVRFYRYKNRTAPANSID
jgi:hypothetical protein